MLPENGMQERSVRALPLPSAAVSNSRSRVAHCRLIPSPCLQGTNPVPNTPSVAVGVGWLGFFGCFWSAADGWKKLLLEAAAFSAAVSESLLQVAAAAAFPVAAAFT